VNREPLDFYLADSNDEHDQALQHEAYQARRRLIFYAHKYIATAMKYDLNSMASDGKNLYTQIHDKSEATSQDSHGTKDTISTKWQKIDKTSKDDLFDELTIHIPLSADMSDKLANLLADIVILDDTVEITELINEFIIDFRCAEINNIVVICTKYRRKRPESTIKYITEHGIVSYELFSEEHQQKEIDKLYETLDNTQDLNNITTSSLKNKPSEDWNARKSRPQNDLQLLSQIERTMLELPIVPQKFL
jgi:hypothetical protein